MSGIQPTDLSVIIPTCPNRADKLRTLLTGIATSTCSPERFEVIVVVDGNDETPLKATNLLPKHIQFTVLTQAQAGPAQARNRAIKQARGRWLLFFNDDIRVDANTIGGHLERIDAHDDTTPRAFLGRMDWANDVLDSPWRRLLADSSMLFFYDQMTCERLYGFRHFWTINLSVPADCVRAVGGFSDEFPFALHEDIELGWRLEQRYGLQVRYIPNSRVWHDHAMTPLDYLRREHLAGHAAARARKINPAFHDAIWSWMAPSEAILNSLQQLFLRPAAEVLQMFDRWARPSADQPTADEIHALYLAHLPLKRLCFVHGYCGGAWDSLWNLLQEANPPR